MQRPCSSKRTFQENGTSLLVYTYGQSPTLTARYRDYLTAQPKILQIVQGKVPSRRKRCILIDALLRYPAARAAFFSFSASSCDTASCRAISQLSTISHKVCKVLQSSAKFCRVPPDFECSCTHGPQVDGCSSHPVCQSMLERIVVCNMIQPVCFCLL